MKIIKYSFLFFLFLFFGIIGYSFFQKGAVHSKTWFCKELDMIITIVHRFSEDDMIILNMTDTIFISDDFTTPSLYGIELHFKTNRDTIILPCDYLTISKIESQQYTIIPVKTGQDKGFTIPIMLDYNDITISGDADSWNFYTFKNGKCVDGLLETVN